MARLLSAPLRARSAQSDALKRSSCALDERLRTIGRARAVPFRTAILLAASRSRSKAPRPSYRSNASSSASRSDPLPEHEAADDRGAREALNAARTRAPKRRRADAEFVQDDLERDEVRLLHHGAGVRDRRSIWA